MPSFMFVHSVVSKELKACTHVHTELYFIVYIRLFILSYLADQLCLLATTDNINAFSKGDQFLIASTVKRKNF